MNSVRQDPAARPFGARRVSQQVSCRVPGCKAHLEAGYSTKYKICKRHYNAPSVDIGAGVMGRFCQQCSKFHPLCEFDDGKLSCRVGLERHTQRRKERQARQRQRQLDQQQSSGICPTAVAGGKRERSPEPQAAPLQQQQESAGSGSPSDSQTEVAWERPQQRPRLVVDTPHTPASLPRTTLPTAPQQAPAQARLPEGGPQPTEVLHQQLLLLSTAAAQQEEGVSPVPAEEPAAAPSQPEADAAAAAETEAACCRQQSSDKAGGASSCSTISLEATQGQSSSQGTPRSSPQPPIELAGGRQAAAPQLGAAGQDGAELQKEQLLPLLHGALSLLQGFVQAAQASAQPMLPILPTLLPVQAAPSLGMPAFQPAAALASAAASALPSWPGIHTYGSAAADSLAALHQLAQAQRMESEMLMKQLAARQRLVREQPLGHLLSMMQHR